MLACRAVLILTEVLLLLMPLTEHFCKWDRFLRGGPDVEFGILSLLLFAGLVLLDCVSCGHLAVSGIAGLPAHRLTVAMSIDIRHLPLTSSSFQARYGQGTPASPFPP